MVSTLIKHLDNIITFFWAANSRCIFRVQFTIVTVGTKFPKTAPTGHDKATLEKGLGFARAADAAGFQTTLTWTGTKGEATDLCFWEKSGEK